MNRETRGRAMCSVRIVTRYKKVVDEAVLLLSQMIPSRRGLKKEAGQGLEGSAFDHAPNKVSLIMVGKKPGHRDLQNKSDVARKLLDAIASIL